VFILWFGWFGFNPGSQLAISGDNAFKVAAILSQQILLELLEHWLQCSWAVYKKPDISMTLNGVLAGLVGVTAGCAAVSQWAFFYRTYLWCSRCILHRVY
jgi:Amt family ammonium transporter